MGHAPFRYNRYLRIAECTSKYKFETLVVARDSLNKIAIAASENSDYATLIEALEACRKLDKVINGTHDGDAYAQAFRISEHVAQFSNDEVIWARNVLRTIGSEDPHYIRAIKARRIIERFVNSSIQRG
jgi:hypothetical protein